MEADAENGISCRRLENLAGLDETFRAAWPYGYANVGALFDPNCLRAAAREID